MSRTPENLWSNNRSIKNIGEIREDLDSMDLSLNLKYFYNYVNTEASYPFFGRNRKLVPPADIARKREIADSLRNLKYQAEYDIEARAENVLSGQPLEATPASEPPADEPRLSASEINGTTSGLPESVDSTTVADSVPIGQNEADNSTIVTSTEPISAPKEETITLTPAQRDAIDSLRQTKRYAISAASGGLTTARNIKNNFTTNKNEVDALQREFRRFQISWYQKYTQAIACFVMFMIGAPLGAIIKKGGLGMPVLVSIIFFVLYYMLTITGEKWAMEGVADPLFGTAFSNLALIPFGLFFLRQARRDARIFEADFYYGLFQRARIWWAAFRKQEKLKEELS
jgi:lipopolysaccharide export system permease protein